MSADRVNEARAQDVLECVLAAAVSPTVAMRHRRGLGAVASWRQDLIDGDLLPEGTRSGEGVRVDAD